MAPCKPRLQKVRKGFIPPPTLSHSVFKKKKKTTQKPTSFSTPPSLHEGDVRAMVGHLKFRVFPPFALQPFIADRLRSINVVGRGKRPLCSATVAETEAEARRAPPLPPGCDGSGGPVHFCTYDPRYLGCWYCAFIGPNNEKKKRGCSGAPRPLEDGLDGSEAVTTIIKGVVRG